MTMSSSSPLLPGFRRPIVRWLRDSVIIAVLASTLVLPAFAQVPPVAEGGEEFRSYTRQSRVDLEQISRELQQITNDLEGIKRQLTNGDIIVRNYRTIVDVYARFQKNIVLRAGTCIELTLDADQLKAEGIPTWKRFNTRAVKCQGEVKKAQDLAKEYAKDFLAVQDGVAKVKRTVEALKKDRDDLLAQQELKRATRDLEETASQSLKDLDMFMKDVLEF